MILSRIVQHYNWASKIFFNQLKYPYLKIIICGFSYRYLCNVPEIDLDTQQPTGCTIENVAIGMKIMPKYLC